MSNRHLPLYILLASGCLLIVAGLAMAVAQGAPPGASAQPGLSKLPRQVAGLALTSQVSGPAALAEIESLHGRGFALTGGQVARYGDATLWIARTRDAASAEQMVETMTARIAEGSSPFLPTGLRSIDAHTVYTLAGMGQHHFYWQAGDQVAWLAIPAAKSEQGLREALAALDQR